MSSVLALPQPRRIDKRLVLTALLLLVTAFAFWTGSRYPSLNEKAMMGGDADVEGLAFTRVVEVDPAGSALERIGANALNWAATNRQGMTFGVLFAGIVLTILPLVTRIRPRGRMTGTLLGVAMGAPLGVCVNCAVPIAEGLHKGGARGETTLAAMLSSPTLNVVVLSMTFALFPVWLAGLKLGMTLAFIVFAVPLLVRVLWPSDALAPTAAELAPAGPTLGPELPAAPALAEATGPDPEPASWLDAAGWTVRALARNLWYIVKTTVPLMALAGLLGAIAVTLVPWESLSEGLPALDVGRATTRALLALGGVALLGAFLPCPIAFDVIICAILGAAGVPLPYVAVMFVTLGLFSAYPLLQIWRTMSRPTAIGLYLGVAALGLAAGWTTALVQPRLDARTEAAVVEAFADAGDQPVARPAFPTEALSADRVAALIAPFATGPGERRSAEGGSVETLALAAVGGEAVAPAFTHLFGPDLGIDEPSNESPNRYLTGVMMNRAAASGDVHGDGWADLVFTSEAGVGLYANVGGERYVRQDVAVPALDSARVGNAALVDLDGDGALDLVVATIGGGNHVVYNDGGAFTEAGHAVLLNVEGAYWTTSLAFGDLDRDGDLDVVLGNTAALNARRPGHPEVRSSFESARDAILTNEGGRGAFALRPLPATPGETLSTLLSDLDGDGDLDLFVGNDFNAPDVLYEGDGRGGFRQLLHSEGVVPHSTITTMSLASADLDNDLVPEVFVAQISPSQTLSPILSPADACADRPDLQRAACEAAHRTATTTFDAQVDKNPAMCLELADAVARQGCVATYLVFKRRSARDDASACREVGPRWPLHRRLCAAYDEPVAPVTDAEAAEAIPDKRGLHNVLLRRDGDGYADIAETVGLDRTAWTWDARFNDFDQDGWLDLFSVAGSPLSRRSHRNSLFRNLGDGRFEDVTEAVGLGSWLPTFAASRVDLDRDGDLDLVVPTALGPVDVYRNEARGHALQIALRDETGQNPFGVGAVVTVRTPSGRTMMREVQASGGFLSFDEPIAHFGLGAEAEAAEVEVRWPTGRTTRVENLAAGARHTIRRER
ncbi:FG-GAP-like repeat-containing protein [Rubrivirga marina]|uniref:ASPIC/UnbV domain-containing protein n=1 Tax=Rubrivirga marina TaxID=1196024 RepID=A0A271IX82_9BACT|nr:FG-GAP-like repeat-containing protein [Rubrivirga marina]PAP75861.1 hypothetical protein BSZ37_05095 [Rubrivirga marina]